MCGITGIVNLKGLDVNKDILHRMNETQHHRGPDEGGLYVEANIGLGHRRLSIIDVTTGQQPLTNTTDDAIIAFNGEVYNFQEVREELEALGLTFATHSDTEVILQAWRAWGVESVQRLRGMFAYAIYDKKTSEVFIARDRLGIKPVYYSTLQDGSVLFGSELKSLMEHPELEKKLNFKAIEDYFCLGYIPDPKTIFDQVHKLPPGYYLKLDCHQGTTELVQYWDASFKESLPDGMSEQTIGEELTKRLKEAVDIRLVAEVPLGAFLSGGVDSSSVVALMSELSDDPVKTCSIGFDVKSYNETEFAEMVATKFKTDHQQKTVAADDFSLVDRLIDFYDEPFADSSAIPTYRVCELAKQRVTVCLSGDGGDELFAGYRRHRWHMMEEKLRQKIPQSIRGPLFGFLGHWYPKLDWAPKIFRAKSTFQALARNSIDAYMHSICVIPDHIRQQLFSDDFKKKLSGYHASEVFAEHQKKFDGDDALSLIQYIDMKTYLPGDILTKVDRASMAHSLEVRVPIIDHKFLEWANKIKSSLKLKAQEGKYIFKKSLESRLPWDILYRDKMGFGVPISKWFRGPLKELLRQKLLEGRLAETGIFNMDFVKTLVNEHISGIGEHSAALWSLLMFEAFLEKKLYTQATE